MENVKQNSTRTRPNESSPPYPRFISVCSGDKFGIDMCALGHSYKEVDLHPGKRCVRDEAGGLVQTAGLLDALFQ